VAKNGNYSTLISEEKPFKPATSDMTRSTKKAAKRNRQRSAKYETAAMVEVGSWRLECTYDGCTAGEGGAKFKTPALAPAQALAKLGLHREDAHGQHGTAAGGGAEKVHLSTIPRPEDQQVLAPEAQQVLAPEAQQVLAPEAQQFLAPESQQILAQEAQHTEEKPLDNTMLGLIRGPDPGLQRGGPDPGLQEGG
jgi:hypothetical protein